jgi:AcrR family transcriptional regulator
MLEPHFIAQCLFLYNVHMSRQMPPEDRKTRKRKNTRDGIVRAAFELFERHGYEAVTMEQIATEADVARGTLYNHFPVKEAVLAHGIHAQLKSSLEPLLERVFAHSALTARLAVLLRASADWWMAHRHYAGPYIRFRFQGVRRDQAASDSSEMINVYARLIQEAQQTNEINIDTPPMRLARYLHYLYLCALMDWMGNADISLEDEFDNVIAFFIRGAGGL